VQALEDRQTVTAEKGAAVRGQGIQSQRREEQILDDRASVTAGKDLFMGQSTQLQQRHEQLLYDRAYNKSRDTSRHL
jgi:hypothetical protein